MVETVLSTSDVATIARQEKSQRVMVVVGALIIVSSVPDFLNFYKVCQVVCLHHDHNKSREPDCSRPQRGKHASTKQGGGEFINPLTFNV